MPKIDVTVLDCGNDCGATHSKGAAMTQLEMQLDAIKNGWGGIRVEDGQMWVMACPRCKTHELKIKAST